MRSKVCTIEIKILMKVTSKVLGGYVPSLKGCSRQECLMIYQDYTRDALEGRTADQLKMLRREMYKEAFALGRRLGRLPAFRSDGSKSRLIRWLYRNIDIIIEGDMPGEVRIPRCSFSDIYTPQMCYVMSGMDAGIICGIFGGGEFEFSARLTEGCEACRAVYRRSSDE